MRAYDGIKAERRRGVTLETPEFLEHARQLLSRSIPVQIRMSGASMRPAIEDGDIITVEPVIESPIKPGDIILYQSQYETAVIHRVIRIEGSSSDDRIVLTRGDASSQNDTPVPLHRVMGRVNRIERAGQRVDVSRSRSRRRLSRSSGSGGLMAAIVSWFRRLKFRPK